MSFPEGDAHVANLLSFASLLVSILLGVPALAISLWAARTSRSVARRTTEPVLSLRVVSPAFRGHIELQNAGAVMASDVRIELIERHRRPSGRLHVGDVLRVGENVTVVAWDFPPELNAEFRSRQIFGDPATDLENIQRSIKGGSPKPYQDDLIAFHLTARKGGQRIVVSCSVPDRRRQVRIYKVCHSNFASPEFRTCSTFLVGCRAAYLRFLFKRNALLMPTVELPDTLTKWAETGQHSSAGPSADFRPKEKG